MRVQMISVLAALPACLGEAEVVYEGAVVEGDATGSRFVSASERAEGVPIAGATVELIVQGRTGESATTDASGAYGPLEQVFGGFVGVDDTIEVKVTTGDGRTFSYTANYDDTTDPTNGAPDYLDFTLAP